MRASDVHAYGDPELVEFIGERRQEVFNLRFQHSTGQLENTAEIRKVRRQVARINTLIRQREIDEAEKVST